MSIARWVKFRRWIAGTRLDPRPCRPIRRVGHRYRSTALRLEALEARRVPTAALAPVAFSVAEDRSFWGSAVQVRYGLTNQGTAASGSLTAQVVLSRDDVIDAADPVLQELSLAGLPPGQSLSGATAVALPGTAEAPPPDFPAGGRVWLGWRLIPGERGTVVTGPDGLHHTKGVIEDRLTVTQVAREAGPNDTPATAMPIQPNAAISGSVAGRGDVDYYSFTLTESSRVEVRVTAATGSRLVPLLKLFGPDGGLLVQSAGPGPGGAGADIVQRLPPGTYLVRVSASGSGSVSPSGRYLLSTEAVSDASLDFTGGVKPIVADVNGDARPDLIGNVREFQSNDGNFIIIDHGYYLGMKVAR